MLMYTNIDFQDNATYTRYNGTAARAIIYQTKSNRTHWEDPISIVENEDIMLSICYAWTLKYSSLRSTALIFPVIPESWNRTISCKNPLKKAEAPKDVYLGNLYLMQYLHIHLILSCEYQAVPDTPVYTSNLKYFTSF
jgi:hypothetical protein